MAAGRGGPDRRRPVHTATRAGAVAVVKAGAVAMWNGDRPGRAWRWRAVSGGAALVLWCHPLSISAVLRPRFAVSHKKTGIRGCFGHHIPRFIPAPCSPQQLSRGWLRPFRTDISLPRPGCPPVMTAAASPQQTAEVSTFLQETARGGQHAPNACPAECLPPAYRLLKNY